MRQFTKVIFCGNGEWSSQQIERLKSRLEGGINLLSGLQQPGHSDTEQAAKEEAQQYEEYMNELGDVVHDIATALGCEALIKDRVFCYKHGWSKVLTMSNKNTCITCLADGNLYRNRLLLRGSVGPQGSISLDDVRQILRIELGREPSAEEENQARWEAESVLRDDFRMGINRDDFRRWR